MRILVLGSGGFIGRHVCSGLASKGHQMMFADIVDTGQPGCKVFDGSDQSLEALFEQTQPEAIVNCSGAASVPASLEDPLQDFRLNTGFVVAALEALRASCPEARFLHLSSAAVYGNPETSPIAETHAHTPLSPYGVHKSMAEQSCRSYATNFGLATLSARIFSAYGPGLRKQLFWDLFQKGLSSKTIELFGTGHETRDFIHVADIVDAFECLLQRASFEGDAYNLASGVAVPVQDAATAFIDAMNWSDHELKFSGAARLGDPDRWCADIKKLEGLGFKPQHSIQSGLAEVAKWLADCE